MKILYHHRTLADGAEGIHIKEMVSAFRQLGNEVLLIGPGVKKIGSSEVRTDKFAWIKKLFKGPMYEIVEIAYNLIGYRSLCKSIETFKPDIIYDRYITFNYSAVAASRKYGLPIFLEVNAPLAYERDHEPDETLYMKKIAYKIEKKVCSDASRTIVVSTSLKEYLVSIGVPEEKIHVLPNGVNTDKFFPRKKSPELMRDLNITEKDLIIGFVGILRPWHGIDLLLDAYAKAYNKFPNSKLLLIGDGPIVGEIENKTEKMGLKDNVTITGRIPHDKVSEYVAMFDIAISPKATFYASPMKIVEYMAQQKAVVAPDMANIRDLITHGQDGVLFKPDDVNDMADSIINLMQSVNVRTSLGEQALSTVENRLNWVNNARFVLDDSLRLK